MSAPPISERKAMLAKQVSDYMGTYAQDGMLVIARKHVILLSDGSCMVKFANIGRASIRAMFINVEDEEGNVHETVLPSSSFGRTVKRIFTPAELLQFVSYNESHSTILPKATPDHVATFLNISMSFS